MDPTTSVHKPDERVYLIVQNLTGKLKEQNLIHMGGTLEVMSYICRKSPPKTYWIKIKVTTGVHIQYYLLKTEESVGRSISLVDWITTTKDRLPFAFHSARLSLVSPKRPCTLDL